MSLGVGTGPVASDNIWNTLSLSVAKTVLRAVY